MKKQLLLFFISALLSTATFSQVKIGYMNPNEALSQIDEVLAIEKQIEQLIQTRDQDLVAKTDKLQQDFTTYEESKGVLSAEARATKEQELLSRNDALEEERQNYLNEIRQKRTQLMTPVIERLNSAIESVAIEMGIDLVLNEATSYGDPIIYYSSEEKLNITAQVVAIISVK